MPRPFIPQIYNMIHPKQFERNCDSKNHLRMSVSFFVNYFVVVESLSLSLSGDLPEKIQLYQNFLSILSCARKWMMCGLRLCAKILNLTQFECFLRTFAVLRGTMHVEHLH